MAPVPGLTAGGSDCSVGPRGRGRRGALAGRREILDWRILAAGMSAGGRMVGRLKSCAAGHRRRMRQAISPQPKSDGPRGPFWSFPSPSCTVFDRNLGEFKPRSGWSRADPYASAGKIVGKTMPDALELLKTRRSLKPVELVAPGPTAAEIDTLLTIASRVPDHGKLMPVALHRLRGRGAGRCRRGDRRRFSCQISR